MLDLSPDAKPIIRRSDGLRVTVHDRLAPAPFDAKKQIDDKERFEVRENIGNGQIGLLSYRELDSQFVNEVTRFDEPEKAKKGGKAK